MGSMLDLVKGISSEPHNRFTVIMGKPGSGKTTYAGTFPKPMLYVAIDSDGGGEVLKCYSDNDVKTISITSDVPGTPGAKHVQMKLMELLTELEGKHPYKSVVIDAYSSIEEGVVDFIEKVKGKKLNLDERGGIATLMLNLRNKIVELSRGDIEYVAICHVKPRQYEDTTTGEATEMIIPKMSYNNGNILLERASAVLYASRKPVIDENGTKGVKFLVYAGAHPNMDTKLRTQGKMNEVGVYVENFDYNKLKELIDGKLTLENSPKINVIENSSNPFDDEEKDKGEW